MAAISQEEPSAAYGTPFPIQKLFLQLLIRNNKSLGKIKMNVSVYLNGFISRSLTSLFTATGRVL